MPVSDKEAAQRVSRQANTRWALTKGGYVSNGHHTTIIQDDSPKGSASKPGRTCEECGISSFERTLLGLRNDRSKDGPRYCLPHHPDSLAGSARASAIVGAL